MAKTYVPSIVIQVHELTRFVTRYNAILRPALATIDPDSVALYDTMYNALVAFDALYQTLYPLEP